MKNVRFEDWEAKQMEGPAFRAVAEQMEPAYQLARLRIMKGLTQKDLADRAGMQQPTVARFESGSDVTVRTLLRVARALDAEIKIVPRQKSKERRARQV